MLEVYGLTLPYDILWEIIELAWQIPLSSQERICFMTSSLLVSRAWMEIFIHITYKDPHIPSPAFLERYLHTLSHGFWFHDESLRDLPSELCRSITIDPQKETGETLSDLFFKVKIMGTLPNLRTVSVVYTEFSFDNVFNCYQFIDFPDRVENLQLYFRIDGPHHCNEVSPPNPMLYVRPPWYIPFLRRLSIFGGDARLIWDYLSACPRLIIIETDFFVDVGAISAPSNPRAIKPEFRFLPPCDFISTLDLSKCQKGLTNMT